LSNDGKLTRRSQVKLPAPAEQLADFGNLLAVQAGRTFELFNITDSVSPVLLGSGEPSGCLGMNLPSADGAVDRGLWVPLSTYGVWKLPLPSGP
jgi:hypothetical protein